MQARRYWRSLGWYCGFGECSFHSGQTWQSVHESRKHFVKMDASHNAPHAAVAKRF
ncbi:Uncharacterised protein [Vibrio cholerae]|nr:Uncharacterised protein [Vibrio cholerae]